VATPNGESGHNDSHAPTKSTPVPAPTYRGRARRVNTTFYNNRIAKDQSGEGGRKHDSCYRTASLHMVQNGLTPAVHAVYRAASLMRPDLMCVKVQDGLTPRPRWCVERARPAGV
jgi:hypothetical protein